MVLLALDPPCWRANARQTCRRLKTGIDALMRRVALGLTAAEQPTEVLPSVATLAARYPKATTLLRRAPRGEALPTLLGQLLALPDGAWPGVTRISDLSIGCSHEDTRLLEHLARLCPGLLSLGLRLADLAPDHLRTAGSSGHTSKLGLTVWASAFDCHGAVAAALRHMTKLQRVNISLALRSSYSYDSDQGLDRVVDALAALPALTKLSWDRPPGELDLAALPRLHDLAVQSCDFPSVELFTGMQHFMEGRLQHLTRLELDCQHDPWASPDKDFLETLAVTCPTLLELRVSDAADVLKLLNPAYPALPNLTRLEFATVLDKRDAGDREAPPHPPRAHVGGAQARMQGLAHVALALRLLQVDSSCFCAALVGGGHSALEEIQITEGNPCNTMRLSVSGCDASAAWLRAAGNLGLTALVARITPRSFPRYLPYRMHSMAAAAHNFEVPLRDTVTGAGEVGADAIPGGEPTFVSHMGGWAQRWCSLQTLNLDIGAMSGYMHLGDLLEVLAAAPAAATLVTLNITAPSHFGGITTGAGDPADALAPLGAFARLELLTLTFEDGTVPGGFNLFGRARLSDARLQALLGPPRPVRMRAPVLRSITVRLTKQQVVLPRCSEHIVQLPAPVSWACCEELEGAHPGLRFEIAKQRPARVFRDSHGEED